MLVTVHTVDTMMLYELYGIAATMLNNSTMASFTLSFKTGHKKEFWAMLTSQHGWLLPHP